MEIGARATPPSNFQDFYDFVIAVCTRALGKIKYYSIWNEISDNVLGWSGTVEEMVTLARNTYDIIKSIDGTAVVLAPSANWVNGPSYMEQFLAAGGGAYADVMNLHAYPYRTSRKQPPEQIWNVVTDFKNAFKYYGQDSKPFWVDEGSYREDIVSSDDLQAAYIAIYLCLLYSAGAERVIWYQYDADSSGEGPDRSFGTLWSPPKGLHKSGISYRETCKWLNGSTFIIPIARKARSNRVRNTTGDGLVTGHHGAAPTHWAVYNPDRAHGISTQFVASGIEDGIPYVDFRVFGMATKGAIGSVLLFFDTAIEARKGQTWYVGANVKVQAGSKFGFGQALFNSPYYPGMGIGFNSVDGGLRWLETTVDFDYNIPLLSLGHCASFYFGEIASSEAAYIQPFVKLAGYSVGRTVDLTLRIGNPLADTGTIWSGVLTKPGGYQAQIIWDSSGGPSIYSTESAYVRYNDVFGNVYLVPDDHRVMLSNSPILLEN